MDKAWHSEIYCPYVCTGRGSCQLIKENDGFGDCVREQHRGDPTPEYESSIYRTPIQKLSPKPPRSSLGGDNLKN